MEVGNVICRVIETPYFKILEIYLYVVIFLFARHKVWSSVVQLHRWWRTIKERHVQVDAKTIKNCNEKPMARGSVTNTRSYGSRASYIRIGSIGTFRNIPAVWLYNGYSPCLHEQHGGDERSRLHIQQVQQTHFR